MKNKLISIIIVAKNQININSIKKSLKAIKNFTTDSKYEIIVIDNTTTDELKKLLSGQKNIDYIPGKKEKISVLYKQAVKLAQGSEILFLDDNIILTTQALQSLIRALYSDEKIAAVTPVTNNCINNQTLGFTDKNVSELEDFAVRYNNNNNASYLNKVNIIAYCMLIKAEIIKKIYLNSNEELCLKKFWDYNISLQIVEAGYKIMQCNNVFVVNIQSGVSYYQEEDKEKIYCDFSHISKKYYLENDSLNPDMFLYLQNEVLNTYNTNVLEIGCSTGSFLNELRNLHPMIDIYGIEKNKNAASIANNFAITENVDIETGEIPYPSDFFDYIILTNKIMEFRQPEKIIGKLVKHLKPAGKLILSFYNIAYYKNIDDILRGKWSYKENIYDNSSQNTNLLLKRYIKYFTLKSMQDIIRQCNLEIERCMCFSEETFDEMSYENFIETYGNAAILDKSTAVEFKVYEYIISISK